MLRRVLYGVAALVALGVAGVAGGVFLAKRAIGALEPPVPPVADLVAYDSAADLPVRISYLNTASQPMPRSGVLDPARDPTPKAPYVMSHAVFVLEWADGRIFLVDAGMDRAAAVAFGRPIELLSGGEPMQPHVSAADGLGGALARVAGIAFTHEHTDHTEGVAELCRLHPEPIALFQNRLQVEESNYTTRGAQAQLDAAPCLVRSVLDDGPFFAPPGFPGLRFFAAAGHTPGSQVFVAHVRFADGAVRVFALTGDIVNQIDGARHNLPKPPLYSLLMVPESLARLDALRRLLGSLEREHGVTLLVSHDRLALEASGVPAFATP